ncbi:hypothetical protein [Erythrobacter donghaensis]|uniref:hypothetical protein n=1 Tax=Erythrobacter donghaensis TaxID=267135 RepID=UPI001180C7E5|nr:hypothetical protein [Erythrobacter donghaensis]
MSAMLPNKHCAAILRSAVLAIAMIVVMPAAASACAMPELNPDLRLQKAKANASHIVVGSLTPSHRVSRTHGSIVPQKVERGARRKRFATIGYFIPCVYESQAVKKARFYLVEVKTGNFMILAIEAIK